MVAELLPKQAEVLRMTIYEWRFTEWWFRNDELPNDDLRMMIYEWRFTNDDLRMTIYEWRFTNDDLRMMIYY